LHRPSWRDPRLLGGLLLVLLSVVGVAGLLRAVDTAEPVFVARHALTPGHRLTHDDLAVVHVRLAGVEQPYLSASDPLGDTVVVRPVPAGELVPSSAVGGADEVDLRPVTVPVDAGAADVLVTGSVVDVWVAGRASGRADGYERPRLVAAGVLVAQRSGGHSGWGGSAGASVQLLLTPSLVPEVISAVDNQARITLVAVPSSLAPARSHA
jgi:hypothetical protein